MTLAAALLLAHWFIPASCCGAGDCFAVPMSQVRDVNGQYEVTTEHGVFMVPMAEPLSSPDEFFYICLKFQFENYGPRQVIERRSGCSWTPRGMV